MQKVIKLIGQLYEVRSRRDGGSRVVIDVGNESIEGILELQKMNGLGDTSLAIALTPFNDSGVSDTEEDLPSFSPQK